MQKYGYKVDLSPYIEAIKRAGCFDIDKVWKRLQYKAPNTQATYLRVFLAFCSQRGFLSENPLEVAKKLILKYKNKNTRLTVYFALKFLFTTLGEKFDVFREEILHDAEETTKERELTTFTEGEIKKLINAAYRLFKEEFVFNAFDYEFKPFEFVTLMLVSSLYGTRRGEFYILSPEDIQIDNFAIYITALKHSRSRKHLIPYDLQILFGYFKDKFAIKAPDPRYYNILFDILQVKAGVAIVKRRNIHAIRKTLTSILLMKGANPVYVNDFLRWKGQGTMMSFYANLDPIYIDTEIFKVHPFVEEWKKVGREFNG